MGRSLNGYFEQCFIRTLHRLVFSLGGGAISVACGHLTATFPMIFLSQGSGTEWKHVIECLFG